MKKLIAAALGLFLAAGASQAKAADAASYYQGKTVTIIVGYAAGGGYSAYAQLIAKYLGNHIPGKPSVIVQQMPGGGSLIAANNVYNVAKPDGLTIGSINMFNLYSSQMSKAEGVHYDLAKMVFVGNVRSGNDIFLTRREAFDNLDALKSATRPIEIGESVKGDGHHIFTVAMAEGLGVNFHHIFGYSGGGGDIDLALERKEIDGRAANLNSYLVSKPDWIKPNGFAKLLSQSGAVDNNGNIIRDSRIPDVPTIHELYPNNKKIEQLMDFASVSDQLSGVYIAPTGTPADLLETLRAAFMATLNDKEFLAEAEKFNLEITPMGAKEVTEILGRALTVSPEIVNMVTDLTK